jgi:hypothetical protein
MMHQTPDAIPRCAFRTAALESGEPSVLFLDATVSVGSIWLQLIWLAVGSTVKTRDLVK